MKCTKCGARLTDTDRYCPKCGTKVIKGKNYPQKKDDYRNEEDWEDEDDDWDDEEQGADIITIMTAIVGCVLLVVVAVLGYHLYQQYVSGDYEDEEQQFEFYESEGQELPGQALEGQQSWESVGEPVSDHYVAVIKNVNVRDNPSTTDSNVLKVAQEGEIYPYAGRSEDGEWIKILLDDNSVGYVFHEYVTVND